MHSPLHDTQVDVTSITIYMVKGIRVNCLLKHWIFLSLCIKVRYLIKLRGSSICILLSDGYWFWLKLLFQNFHIIINIYIYMIILNCDEYWNKLENNCEEIDFEI